MGKIKEDQFIYANKDWNENKDDTKYFLVLSGGAFRGAVQFWVISHLMAAHHFEHISGVSVGSINGACAAMHKLHELFDFWNDIENKGGYLRTRWLYLIGFFTGIVKLLNMLGAGILPGVYSMKPLKNKLKEQIELEKIHIPFSCGMVTAEGGDQLYFQVNHQDMRSNEDAVQAILASSCMVPFMKPELYDIPMTGRGPEIAIDGGYWNIIPIPWAQIAEQRKSGSKVIIQAIGCTPLSRVPDTSQRKLLGMIPMTIRAIQLMEAAIYDGDILQLQLAAGEDGEVHLWVPSMDTGESFDASKDTIQGRLAESKRMVQRGPIVLPGIGTLEQLLEFIPDPGSEKTTVH